jgi:hypothetical protein
MVMSHHTLAFNFDSYDGVIGNVSIADLTPDSTVTADALVHLLLEFAKQIAQGMVEITKTELN